MADRGAYTCPDCNGPLRYGLMGFACVNGATSQPRCYGRRRVQPKDKLVHQYRCNRCKTKAKIPAGDPRPSCETEQCRGMMLFVKAMTR